MNVKVAILCALSTTTLAGCKGGSGGGWLVGSSGLMANVDTHGQLGDGYDLGVNEQLNGISCRYLDEAWVVGNNGLVLYTSDAGKSWAAHDLGTTANLRSLATQDEGPVFVVGDGVFMTANPTYTTGAGEWTQLGDGTTNFRSVSAAQQGDTVLAVSDDGGVWAYAAGQLTRRTTLPGMRSIAVSPDGHNVFAVGNGLYRSTDSGITWNAIAVDPSFAYQSVSIDETGEAVAVGDAGVVSRIDVEGRVLTQHVGDAALMAIHISPSDDYTGVGYASGVGGQVWLTEDSGWSWKMGPNVGQTVLAVDEIGLGHN